VHDLNLILVAGALAAGAYLGRLTWRRLGYRCARWPARAVFIVLNVVFGATLAATYELREPGFGIVAAVALFSANFLDAFIVRRAGGPDPVCLQDRLLSIVDLLVWEARTPESISIARARARDLLALRTTLTRRVIDAINAAIDARFGSDHFDIPTVTATWEEVDRALEDLRERAGDRGLERVRASIRRVSAVGKRSANLLRPSVERTAAVLTISNALAGTLLAGAGVLILVVVGVAVRAGLGPIALGGALAILVVLASFRWPLLPLFAFVILTPVEDVVVVGPFGSLSRYGEILFVLAYALPRLGRLEMRAIPLSAWGFVIWVTLSVSWALDRSVSIQELPILGLLFVTGLAVAALVVERPTMVRPLIWAYSASAFVVAAYGLFQFIQSGAVTGPNDRAAAFENQNPAYFAAFLLPALVFSVNELLNWRAVLASAAVASVTAGAILASGTRAAWFGAALAILFVVVPRLSPARRLAAVCLAATLSIGIFQVSSLTTLIVDRAALALSTGGAGRTDIWTVGLSIYESAPLTGVGISNYPVAYTPEIVRSSAVGVYSSQNGAYRAPHNIVVETLAELGPVGLALLAVFLIPLIARAGWGPEGPVVQAVVVSLVTTSFFLDILNRKQFWLFLAIACGLALLRSRRRVLLE
jgi:O-antigen ligase